MHTFMVIIHGVPKEFAAIVLGDPDGNRRLALGIGLAGLFAILVFHVVITWFSLRYRRRTQRLLGLMVDPFERVISRLFTSRQHFGRSDISPYHRVNGYPPAGAGVPGAWPPTDFRDYRLSVGGLVDAPDDPVAGRAAQRSASRARSPSTTASRAGPRSPNGRAFRSPG